jgi:two-component system sensor histidine kinase/response regulator
MESGIDIQALERLGRLGGQELISKMVALFTSHAESALRDAATGLSSGNFDRVRRAAHSLKSSAGNLGAQRVQDLAGRIEQLAEECSGGIQPLLTELEDAYLKAKGRLSQEIREEDKVENSDR